MKSKGNIKMKKNIVLIGFMGSGKSTVGKSLASQLEYQFLDTDEEIEKKEKKTINKLFAEQGERYFRTCETEFLKGFESLAEHKIISTGGGMPLFEENGTILKKLGFVVYLSVEKDTVVKRLQGDTTRPLLAGEDAEQKISDLLEYRSPIYEYTAHITVKTDNKTIEEITEEIIRNYKLMEKDSKLV